MVVVIALSLDNGVPLVGVDYGGYSAIAIDMPADSLYDGQPSMMLAPTAFASGNLDVISSGATGEAGNIYSLFQAGHDFVVLYYGGFGIFTGMWNA